jgi:uncharacterized repeat protein (TIGR01451 family)
MPVGAMMAGGPPQSPVAGPWAPPGMSRPWPEDEYLADGGDAGLPATSASDWEVRNLGPEDTIVHFDTLDGQTIVEPSNRVHIYSPRFGAVRKVVSLRQNDQLDRWGGMYLPAGAIRRHEVLTPGTNTQNLPVESGVGQKLVTIYRSKQGDGAMSTVDGPLAHHNFFLPFEDLAVIRQGILEEAEMARLAQGVNAALAWTHHQAVQVILDHQAAMEDGNEQSLESVFTIKRPPADPKLRVIKVASTQLAERGETVDFTIRFDNVGNQLIGNVTIIDNLTTRLEYVPDSAQCSLPAGFSTQRSQSESLVLRWEISDPVEPGQGGICRFQCRVR